MSGLLNGRVAVITGASKGLGKAMAVALAAEGARVALVSRDKEQLHAVAAGIVAAGGDASVHAADVTSEGQVRHAEHEIVARYGKVNILVNNAGVNVRKPVVDFTMEEWRRVMDTNVTAAFLMCRSFVPAMTGQGYGRILNMTSIMSHVSLPGRIAYSTSKTALLGMTRTLALELAPEGITVNGISPGPFGTEMNKPLMENPETNAQFLASIPLGRWGKVEEIGRLAVYLCSPDAGFITGTDILIDGGWCAR
jgi:NAD(P)-dependent dehydrogenase (short-subunit alcohol dehydrogenase family)